MIVTILVRVHLVHVEVHAGHRRSPVDCLVKCVRVAVLLAALALGAHVAIGVTV